MMTTRNHMKTVLLSSILPCANLATRAQSTDVPVTETKRLLPFGIAPRLNYQRSLDSDFENKLYGGVTFSYSF